jgi:4'-phosphopantetheinyl transferase
MTAAWDAAAPGPVAGNVVWRVDLRLSDACLRRMEPCLSAEERARAARFARAEDLRRFVAGHAALRFILGRAVHAEPAELDFVAGRAGKPELGPGWSGAPHFNLSHSGDWALIGLSSAGRIGVDVEATRAIRDAAQIARTHFHPSEAAVIASLSGQAELDAFFAVWTCKEAFVKALGLGLSMPLDAFAVAVPPAPAGLVWVATDLASRAAWSLHQLTLDEGHIGAVAIEAREAFLSQRNLPPDWTDLLARSGRMGDAPPE